MMLQHDTDTKKMMILRKCIERIAEDYVARKPDVFAFEETKEALIDKFDEEDNEELLCKVRISVIHFGLLRQSEILDTQMKDAEIEKEFGRINFSHETKRRKKGFMFKVPGWLADTLAKHVKQIKPGTNKKDRFMRNWNHESCKRVQNMGEG